MKVHLDFSIKVSYARISKAFARKGIYFNGYNYVKKQGAHKAFIWKIIRFPQREVLNIHDENTNVI